ncbi:MAG: maleylacetoacetate isomerase [Parvibaculaceae bacterium]
MKLYGYYRSSTSYRVRIALGLKGLKYDQVEIDLKTGEQRSEAFAKINPHQTVPALQIDGRVISQSLAILDWLETAYPEPSLRPSRTEDRLLCSQVYFAIASEVHAVNNLPVLNHLRNEFSANTSDIEGWYSVWVRKTFSAVERRLSQSEWRNEDLPFAAPSLFEVVLIPQVYNAQRWNVAMDDFPLISQINAYCNGIEAFADAHPDSQKEKLDQ